jgi:hypothetical protein
MRYETKSRDEVSRRLVSSASLLSIDPTNGTGPVTSWGEFICETSYESPLVKESRVVVELLKASDKWCKQTNISGSKCSKKEKYKESRAAVCGTPGLKILCHELGSALELIVKNCEKNSRAGGKWIFTPELRGILCK